MGKTVIELDIVRVNKCMNLKRARGVLQIANPQSCKLHKFLLNSRPSENVATCGFSICGLNIFYNLQIAISGLDFLADLRLGLEFADLRSAD
jgi:hypothetical protein